MYNIPSKLFVDLELTLPKLNINIEIYNYKQTFYNNINKTHLCHFYYCGKLYAKPKAIY